MNLKTRILKIETVFKNDICCNQSPLSTEELNRYIELKSMVHQANIKKTVNNDSLTVKEINDIKELSALSRKVLSSVNLKQQRNALSGLAESLREARLQFRADCLEFARNGV